MNISKNQLYKRQVILPEIGVDGQEKLLNSKIAIIGCGGLGSTAAIYLASTGLGHVHLIDYDTVDQSNLHRQVFYGTEDIGKSKAQLLKAHIHKISPFVQVSISESPINKSNIHDQLNDYNILLDCTDSLATKYLINDYCVLTNSILIYGSLYKHDGYVGTFNMASGKKRSANLRDAFPEIPKEHIPTCSEIGTLNPIVGIIALLQANEVIKIVCETGKPLKDQLLIYNSMENTQFLMKLKAGFSKEKIERLYQTENYYDARCEVQNPDLLISAKELKARLNDSKFKILSVIENTDTELPFMSDLRIPLSKLRVSDIDSESTDDIVIVCNKGITSYKATLMIKKQFPHINVFSLKNGIENF